MPKTIRVLLSIQMLALVLVTVFVANFAFALIGVAMAQATAMIMSPDAGGGTAFSLISMLQEIPGIGPYVPYALMLFGVCAVIAAQLPPPKSSGVYSTIYSLVNMLAHNYNQAANASAPAAKPSVPPAAVMVLLTMSVLSLGACAGSSPAADVAALEAGLTAAEGAATAYITLAPCTGTDGPLCSTASIVAQIKAADIQAYALVKAAEAAAGDPTSVATAQAAVAALLTLVPPTPPKQGT
jgi:pyrimidine deaminase RibD-like protein